MPDEERPTPPPPPRGTFWLTTFVAIASVAASLLLAVGLGFNPGAPNAGPLETVIVIALLGSALLVGAHFWLASRPPTAHLGHASRWAPVGLLVAGSAVVVAFAVMHPRSEDARIGLAVIAAQMICGGLAVNRALDARGEGE